MAKPNFAIFRIDPVYCSITDAHIGSQTVDTGLRYQTAGVAHKLAGRMTQADYEACGDSFYRVHGVGDRRPVWPPLPSVASDDIPF